MRTPQSLTAISGYADAVSGSMSTTAMSAVRGGGWRVVDHGRNERPPPPPRASGRRRARTWRLSLISACLWNRPSQTQRPSPGEVVGVGLEHRGRDLARLVAHLAELPPPRPAPDTGVVAAAVGADAVRSARCRRGAPPRPPAHAELLGHDLAPPCPGGLRLGAIEITALPTGALAGPRRRSSPGPGCHGAARPVPTLAENDTPLLQPPRSASPPAPRRAGCSWPRCPSRTFHRRVVAGTVGRAGGWVWMDLFRARRSSSSAGRSDRLHLEARALHHGADAGTLASVTRNEQR